jgi:hypothetical protein
MTTLQAKPMVVAPVLDVAKPESVGIDSVALERSWADPETGVSFTYLTNSQVAEPWHTKRLDEIAVMAHAAIAEL